MKIGIDATFIGTPRPTGLGVYTARIIDGLFRLHENLIVWTIRHQGVSIPAAKIRTVLASAAFLGKFDYLFRPLWMELLFAGKVRREGVDVLFSTVPGGMASCPVPHVMTVHDLTPLTFPADSPLAVRLNFRHRLGSLLRKTAAVITVSQATKDDVCSWYRLPPEKVHVVALGYDNLLYAPGQNPEKLSRYGLLEKPYILAVGSVSPRKNLSRLIQAFGMLRDKDHLLVLAGFVGERERAVLFAQAAAAGVTERLRFLGYLPLQDLAALYAGATLFCYPSLYEGFGLPVLEAMACGTPVVASCTTSIPEVAGDAALLVDPADPEAIATAVTAVIESPETSSRLRVAGLERVKGFRWDKAARETLSILSKVG